MKFRGLQCDMTRCLCCDAVAVAVYIWRGQIELCARLLAVASNALAENPGLVMFAIGAQVGPVPSDRWC